MEETKNKKPFRQLYADDHNSDLSYDDEKWISENLILPKEEAKLQTSNENKRTTENSVNLNGSVSATYKRTANSQSILSKPDAISKLKGCNYRTPPREVESYLGVLFSRFETKEGHWLWITQHYTPRTINRVIARIIKQHQRGERTIKNAAAYFTFLIKKRKQRKVFRSSNATHKQQIPNFKGGGYDG